MPRKPVDPEGVLLDLKPLPNCRVCLIPYDPKKVKRVYGETPIIHRCCSAQCYTAYLNPMDNIKIKRKIKL